MSKTHWSAKLKKLGACSDAVEFARQHDTLEAAWAVCKRGDWMLWLLGKLAGPRGSDARKPLVLAACGVREGEERPLRAIEETAEQWARAYAAAAAARDSSTLARCADLVRERFPEPPALEPEPPEKGGAG